MSHPLLDVDRIDGPPRPFLASIGEVFARFGMHTQDSGNESYGLHIGGRRFFVKTTDPDVEVYCDHSARVELLHNAARVYASCPHPILTKLHRIVECAHGPMLIYEWVNGKLLRGSGDPQSPHERFRQLPVTEILTVLDAVYDLHDQFATRGWIAVDFYDGCLIYDFNHREIRVVDLDHYRHGPSRNDMGRMFGSSRFMAPEEYELDAVLDERTTTFTMGRAAAIFLSDNSLERAPFRGDDALYEVVTRACRDNPDERYPTMKDFFTAWQEARQQ